MFFYIAQNFRLYFVYYTIGKRHLRLAMRREKMVAAYLRYSRCAVNRLHVFYNTQGIYTPVVILTIDALAILAYII